VKVGLIQDANFIEANLGEKKGVGGRRMYNVKVNPLCKIRNSSNIPIRT
jgi:hypothetical protein